MVPPPAIRSFLGTQVIQHGGYAPTFGEDEVSVTNFPSDLLRRAPWPAVVCARANPVRPKKIIGNLPSSFRESPESRANKKVARQKIVTFPLGYTNKFCIEYSTKFNLLGRQSLIQHRFSVHRASADSGREILISFIGGPGRIQREALFHVFRQGSKLIMLTQIIRDGWLGHGGAAPSASDYVETFLNSRFVAYPPGAIAKESFRTVEGQVCGAEPIGPMVCLTQRTIDSVHLGFTRVHYWSQAKRVINQIG